MHGKPVPCNAWQTLCHVMHGKPLPSNVCQLTLYVPYLCVWIPLRIHFHDCMHAVFPKQYTCGWGVGGGRGGGGNRILYSTQGRTRRSYGKTCSCVLKRTVLQAVVHHVLSLETRYTAHTNMLIWISIFQLAELTWILKLLKSGSFLVIVWMLGSSLKSLFKRSYLVLGI